MIDAPKKIIVVLFGIGVFWATCGWPGDAMARNSCFNGQIPQGTGLYNCVRPQNSSNGSLYYYSNNSPPLCRCTSIRMRFEKAPGCPAGTTPDMNDPRLQCATKTPLHVLGIRPCPYPKTEAECTAACQKSDVVTSYDPIPLVCCVNPPPPKMPPIKR